MSWLFVLQCTASDVFWIVRQYVYATCSGFDCGCIAQHAIGLQNRSEEGELLLDSFFSRRLKVMVILQMLVVGPLFQIAAFLVKFLALPFHAFTLSFLLGRIVMVFQVSILYVCIKSFKR